MLQQRSRPRNAWLLISLFWLAAMVTKFKFNGLVYGLDFGLYQPDGTFYTFKTLRLLGHSSLSSANEIAAWYQEHAFKMNIIDPKEFLSGYKDSWALVETRYLYPILSIPFVALFGIPGMIAIPAIALLVTAICAYELCRNYQVQSVGLTLAILLTILPTLNRWSFVNCTDSILMAIFALAAVVLVKSSEKKYLLLSILVFLSSITRFSLPIWLAIFLILALRKMDFIKLFTISMLASLLALPALASAPNNAVLASEKDYGLLEKIFYLPISFMKITLYEFAEMFVLDRILFLLLVFGVIYSLIKLPNLESQLFLGVLISTLLLGAINGTVGVNFRYQLPSIPFLIPVLANVVFNLRVKEQNVS